MNYINKKNFLEIFNPLLTKSNYSKVISSIVESSSKVKKKISNFTGLSEATVERMVCSMVVAILLWLVFQYPVSAPVIMPMTAALIEIITREFPSIAVESVG